MTYTNQELLTQSERHTLKSQERGLLRGLGPALPGRQDPGRQAQNLMSISLELRKSLPAGHHLPMRSPVLTLVGGGFRLGRATGAALPVALFLAGCQGPNSLPIEAWEPTTVRANFSHLGQQPQAARHVIPQPTGAPDQPSHPSLSW